MKTMRNMKMAVACGWCLLLLVHSAQSQSANGTISPESNPELEHKVYSLLIKSDKAPGLMPPSKTHFVITMAVQNKTSAKELQEKFGEPKLTEKGVEYDTMHENMIQSSHQGDLWFYGRLGVLIENGEAVAIVRRAFRQGDDKKSVARTVLEAMNIGKPPSQ